MATTQLATHQKPWSEAELRERLRNSELRFPPATLQLLPFAASFAGASSLAVDGAIEIGWQGNADRFVFEYKAQSTPKALETAIAEVQRCARSRELRPLVIVPYLSETALRRLEAEGISGLDLSGNGVLLAASFALRRSGEPNRFKEVASLRNVFSGNSSLLARCLLLRAEYTSLTALRAFALERFRAGRDASAAHLTKGTVSKVMQLLEEENIVARQREGLRLTDPATLLDRLKAQYRKPRGARLEGKMPFNPQDAWERLAGQPFRAVVSGEGSAGHYRVLSGQDRWTVYVDDLQRARQCLEITPTPLFPNVELIEEAGDTVYFDARAQGPILWASPIQTWLELAHAGPRERAAADVLESIFRKGEGATLV